MRFDSGKTAIYIVFGSGVSHNIDDFISIDICWFPYPLMMQAVLYDFCALICSLLCRDQIGIAESFLTFSYQYGHLVFEIQFRHLHTYSKNIICLVQYTNHNHSVYSVHIMEVA